MSKGSNRDWGRSESNSSKNPTTGDVQEKGGCYLTTACVQHLQERFVKILRLRTNN